MNSFTRLSRRLHLSTGFLVEHQPVTEGIERERNRVGYAQDTEDLGLRGQRLVAEVESPVDLGIPLQLVRYCAM